MDPFDCSEPRTSDYYADLGLPQQADFRDIKAAFFTLAKRHHPDKKAPGVTIDAQDFRKIREAYECLKDEAKRAAYDTRYFDLQVQWTRYREQQETQRKHEVSKRADEEQRAACERAERERKAADAEKTRKLEEEKRAAREKAERARMREERARQAEERSEEAARRAREQQEQAAKERLRKEKEREAERRSEAAASKVRIEQERAARERLKSILIEEKQDAIRHNWTKMREEAKHREGETVRPTPPESTLGCDHPRLGWPRKKGRANCIFCKESCPKWSFQCPECNVSACQGCKSRYCLY